MCLFFFFFLRLKPFTSYQFRVKATNDIGDSEYSQESETITTLQDGKRRRPKKRTLASICSTLGTILSACLYSTVLTLDFPSEYFTSTVHVFTPAPLHNRLFELCIAPLGCVGL